MVIQHGHIYFVEFEPSTGHEFKKQRPAIVISSNALMKRSNLFSCIPLTSNTDNANTVDDILIK